MVKDVDGAKLNGRFLLPKEDKVSRRSFALASVVLALCGRLAWSQQSLFPFVVSYDTPENVTNVAAWLARPAGGQGFVRAKDGGLVTDTGPVRFWATNLCFDACFPEREQAERVAARLARLGINCVRMHHMDSRSIWGKSPDKTTIDAERMARLDYLIYQLKLHGVYTNINLHVSRWLGDKEGFVKRQERPKYDKGLGNFEPRMIQLQKKYARDLLTHVNPHTKTTYTDEPAIAFVEISNEDALFSEWNRGSMDKLPEPYADTYRQLWNQWLQRKYQSTQALRQAWKAGEWPLGKEMLVNGDFAQASGKPWSLQRDKECVVEQTVEKTGPDGQRCLRLVVKRQGRVSWVPQLSQGGLAVKSNTPHTLSFWARSDKSRRLSINCMMNHEPWQRLGLSASVDIGKDWREYRKTFVVEQDDPKARITFSGLVPGTYELARVSLRPGGIVGLKSDQRLEDASVPVLLRRQMNLTKAAQHDFIDFLWETERDYWWGMYRFLKDDLKVRSLVSGTQLNYGPVHIQAKLDYIDAHSYWNHPVFPNRPWDGKDWYVRNIALVNSPGGTLASLAVRRVAGMAYTVSEYNHPAPNSYAAEGFPMIAAFGRLQSWDGIYSFTYSHSTDFESRRLASYFDIKSDPSRMVHMPACAAMFLRGDVAPARQTLLTAMPAEVERAKLHETGNARSLTARELGFDSRLSLLHGVALSLSDAPQPDPPELAEDTTLFVSDTGQIRWDVSQENAGYVVVNTPRSKLFTGFVHGRTFKLGNIELALGKTRLDWATVSITSMDGTGFDGPGRILIAATSWLQNTGAKLEELGKDRATLRNRWGSEPVLCEGIPATITLPVGSQRAQFYPLDESGNRRAAVPCKNRDGHATVELSPRHRTLWYEVVIR